MFMNTMIRSIFSTQRVLIVLSLSVTVFHIFPVIATPITSITLSSFMHFSYGVFGWCFTAYRPSNLKVCTTRSIGYKYLNTNIYGDILYLPSDSKFSISRLLVVHIIALINSVILSVMILMIEFTHYGNSAQFILITALVSLPLFIFSLFCFLVDILLFSTHLDWPGWLMLLCAVEMAFVCSFLWSLRRIVSIRNYEASNNRHERYQMDIIQESTSDEPQQNKANESLVKPSFTYKTQYL